jgi:hypothetical protein
VQRLSRALEDRGVQTIVSIHDEDHYSADLVPPTQAEVVASIEAELVLERKWRVYVDAKTAGPRLNTVMALRKAYRRSRLAPPWRRTSSATETGARMLRRLVNIELAHLRLMRDAMQCEAPWVLIVEDDAQLDDVDMFATALADFMESRSPDPQPVYVNVSRSFGHAALGLAGHLTPIGDWSPGVVQHSADRPLTNTVCAILYRGRFLATLLPAMDAISMSPVLPIDWKLNAALLELHDRGALGPGDCWFLDPGPITQGSMHTVDTTHTDS